ncbi:histidine kinase [hydrothermal vent metagenome]|uniref:Histidine kinase n=1 Tax=hydrothermal vent metagenome TaxID=652676 RepID=A0A1W1EJ25_9ZZZZ
MEDMKELLAKSKSLKLLYVEDNEIVRKSNLELLNNFFDNIDTAQDGLDGLEKFKQNSYDIIITDINMPIMNGIEMITHIRDVDNDVIILVISAHNNTSYFTDTIKLDIQGYILKPTSIKQLIDALKQGIKKISLKENENRYKNRLKESVKIEIKKREETEALLLQQSKMASMGEMIGNIAHQWRQPLAELTLIIQSFKTAQKRGILDEKFIENRVNKSMGLIDNMSQTIEDFRNFYSPKKNKTQFSIIKSIKKSLDIFEGAFANNSIEVRLKYDDSSNFNLYGYAYEVEQVFMNLLSNAKDSIVEASLDRRVLFIEIVPMESNITIFIRDNGLGLDDKIKDKIFEPYFTTKDDDKGTGIGLYMSKKIVNQHLKGSLTASNVDFMLDNELFSGAEFILKLPRIKEIN